MIRIFLFLSFFICFHFIEVSFIASIPSIFQTLPFVLLSSVIVFQYYGIPAAGGWMILHGLLLDVFQIGSSPVNLISYIGAFIMVSVTAQTVFSNRSFYGMAGAVICSLLALSAVEFILFGILATFKKETFYILPFLEFSMWRLLITLLFLIPFFPLIRWSRTIIYNLFGGQKYA